MLGYDTIRQYVHKNPTTYTASYTKHHYIKHHQLPNATNFLDILSDCSLCTKYIHITHYMQLFTQNMTTPSNSTFFVTTATENISG